MKKATALPQPMLMLAKELVNNTPAGDVGYAEAADAVAENWSRFEEVGATVNNIETITGYIRWAKCEGFCASCPIT